MILEWRYRHLLRSLLRRQIEARFRGTWLGVGWMVLLPLLMLGVYTLVFDRFLKVRWPGVGVGEGGGLETALRIYLGLLVFNYFSENLAAAPRLVLDQAQLVKKVVFPLPILASVAAVATLIPLLVGLMIAALLAWFIPDAHLERLPALLFYWAPLLFYALAIHWWLGALGVYLRDLNQLMGPLATLLMFLGPVFYARETLEQPWSFWLLFNPLTVPIEAARHLLFGQDWPDPMPTLIALVVAFLLALVGRWLFRKLQSGFADVL